MSIFKTIAFSASLAAAAFPTAGHAAKVKTLHVFAGGADGDFPDNELIVNSGVLYGTTLGDSLSNDPPCGAPDMPCGTVFSINSKTGAYAVLYAFKASPDGVQPSSPLLYANNTLYGTTAAGGAAGYGTLFSVNPATGAETVVYSFAGSTAGNGPASSLIYQGGLIYGTTKFGGDTICGCGAIYALNPATGAETVLYRFLGGTDGSEPMGDLAIQGTTLYGTTYAGGTNGTGTGTGAVFSFDLSTNTETVLYGFPAQPSTDGAFPYAGVTLQAGMLYGTTEQGGGTPCTGDGFEGCGTVFQVNPATGTETVLYRFPGAGGPQTPVGPAVLLNGSLYTTSTHGGNTSKLCRGRKKLPDGCGTILAVDPSTGTAQVAYSFTGKSDGSGPDGLDRKSVV